MEQDRIKERLLKMYRLATDGVDGEKETAKKILETNLAKYGLTYTNLKNVSSVLRQNLRRWRFRLIKVTVATNRHKTE